MQELVNLGCKKTITPTVEANNLESPRSTPLEFEIYSSSLVGLLNNPYLLGLYPSWVFKLRAEGGVQFRVIVNSLK